MKSKSFELPNKSADKVKQTTYDFSKFWKPASDISVNLVEKRKSDDRIIKENVVSNKLLTSKRGGNKKNKKFQNIFNPSTELASLDDSKLTSTPNVLKKDVKPEVKYIIKNNSTIESSMEESDVSISNIKSKKRNKSVSFMLDDTEGVAMKRSKSEEAVSNPEKLDKNVGKIKKPKKSKQKLQDEKENKGDLRNKIIDTGAIEAGTSQLNNKNTHEVREKTDKKYHNKVKKAKTVTVQVDNSVTINREGDEVKIKKIKKKKRHFTPTELDTENAETDGEPAQKSPKKYSKPDKIALDLENLNIGDNAHTLTNLLDEMTVVDKNKKKKNKQKIKDKEKKNKPTISTGSESEGAKKKGKDKKHKIDKTVNSNAEQSTKTEGEVSEEKEKVKWVKRKWNKDKKGGAGVDKHLTSLIVENLPFDIMFTYKKLLAEHFEKFGMIRQVGIAEMYPTEDPKPVFTTTINFYSEDGAEKALEEDNTVFQGARIRVKRPQPPTLTTMVVRSYADLTEQTLSSAFSGAGRIRSIRLLVKGKKSLSTAFIEFDGPKSVERAIKMVDDAKIGGKKIHVAKYELRDTNKKRQDKSRTEEQNGDSDTSNE